MDIVALDKRLKQTNPNIVGVSIADPTDKSTWRVDYDKEPSDAEREVSRLVILGFDEKAPARPRLSLEQVLIRKGIITEEDFNAGLLISQEP